MSDCFTQERITATKNRIVAYENALLAFADDGIQQYTLDTGQSVQKVTRFDIPRLEDTLVALYNLCAVLEARLNGSGTVTVGPAW